MGYLEKKLKELLSSEVYITDEELKNILELSKTNLKIAYNVKKIETKIKVSELEIENTDYWYDSKRDKKFKIKGRNIRNREIKEICLGIYCFLDNLYSFSKSPLILKKKREGEMSKECKETEEIPKDVKGTEEKSNEEISIEHIIKNIENELKVLEDLLGEKEVSILKNDFNVLVNNYLYWFNKYLIDEEHDKITELMNKLDFMYAEKFETILKKEKCDFEPKSFVRKGYCVQIIRGGSVSDFIKKGLIISNKIKEENKDAEVFFRGQPNSKWDSQAGIFRGTIKREREIYDEILSIVPNSFRNSNPYEHLLTIQHYGGPTRLIDVTQNILMAAFFATYDEKKEQEKANGRIFFFKEDINNIRYFNSDRVLITASLARMKSDFNYYLHKDYLYHAVRDYRPHFEKIIDPNHLFTSHVVKGVMSNERIDFQSGDFILVGMSRNDKMKPATIPQSTKYAIIIKAKAKDIILKELETYNVHAGTVYPDTQRKIEYVKSKWSR